METRSSVYDQSISAHYIALKLRESKCLGLQNTGWCSSPTTATERKQFASHASFCIKGVLCIDTATLYISMDAGVQSADQSGC